MNKTSLLTTVFAVTASYTFAQVHSFQVDDKVHYCIEHYTPGSDLAFLSTLDGGKMIRLVTLNDNGGLTVVDNESFKPLRVYSQRAKNKQGVAGSGKIEHLAPKEFTLRHLKLEQSGGVAAISWKAQAGSEETVVFKLLRSNDGIRFREVNTYNASPGAGFTEYHFADNNAKGSVYKLEVWNVGKGLRHTSDILSAGSEIQVYPTMAATELNIAAEGSFTYKVYNSSGQVMDIGTSQAATHKLDISSFVPGIYYLSVLSENKQYTRKFVKL